MLPHVTESTLPSGRPRSYAANSARQYFVAAYGRILTRLLGIAAGFVYVVQRSYWEPRYHFQGFHGHLPPADAPKVQRHAQQLPYEHGAPAYEQFVDVLVWLATSPPIALALVLATIATVLLAR